MRITVAFPVNLVTNGMGTEEIIEAYPDLDPEDHHQALQYVAWLVEEKIQPLGLASMLRERTILPIEEAEEHGFGV